VPVCGQLRCASCGDPACPRHGFLAEPEHHPHADALLICDVCRARRRATLEQYDALVALASAGPLAARPPTDADEWTKPHLIHRLVERDAEHEARYATSLLQVNRIEEAHLDDCRLAGTGEHTAAGVTLIRAIETDNDPFLVLVQHGRPATADRPEQLALVLVQDGRDRLVAGRFHLGRHVQLERPPRHAGGPPQRFGLDGVVDPTAVFDTTAEEFQRADVRFVPERSWPLPDVVAACCEVNGAACFVLPLVAAPW
jgi:hypothetical protein